MTDQIPKHVTDRDEWSPDDFFNYAKTGQLPVNPAWRKARDQALEDAGLEVDDVDGAALADDLEAMTIEQHALRKHGPRS